MLFITPPWQLFKSCPIIYNRELITCEISRRLQHLQLRNIGLTDLQQTGSNKIVLRNMGASKSTTTLLICLVFLLCHATTTIIAQDSLVASYDLPIVSQIVNAPLRTYIPKGGLSERLKAYQICPRACDVWINGKCRRDFSCSPSDLCIIRCLVRQEGKCGCRDTPDPF